MEPGAGEQHLLLPARYLSQVPVVGSLFGSVPEVLYQTLHNHWLTFPFKSVNDVLLSGDEFRESGSELFAPDLMLFWVDAPLPLEQVSSAKER